MIETNHQDVQHFFYFGRIASSDIMVCHRIEGAKKEIITIDYDVFMKQCEEALKYFNDGSAEDYVAYNDEKAYKAYNVLNMAIALLNRHGDLLAIHLADGIFAAPVEPERGEDE